MHVPECDNEFDKPYENGYIYPNEIALPYGYGKILWGYDPLDKIKRMCYNRVTFKKERAMTDKLDELIQTVGEH